MNSKRYPVNNYVPTAVKIDKFNNLDTRLKQMTFDEIINDPHYHFENCYLTNFDLIHHECRGDKISHSRKHYQTIANENLKKNILDLKLRQKFVSSAI